MHKTVKNGLVHLNLFYINFHLKRCENQIFSVENEFLLFICIIENKACSNIFICTCSNFYIIRYIFKIRYAASKLMCISVNSNVYAEQETVQITVPPSEEQKSIAPYIYGVNNCID